jgi:hypothetical protein
MPTADSAERIVAADFPRAGLARKRQFFMNAPAPAALIAACCLPIDPTRQDANNDDSYKLETPPLNYSHRLPGNAAALLLALSFVSVAQAQEGNSAASCRAITDQAARLACYDKLAGQPPNQASEPAAGSIDPEPPKREPRRTKRIEENKEPKQFTVTLERVSRTLTGKAMLVTTDGAIWVQTDTKNIHVLPKAGTQIEIERGALSSHFCHLSRNVAVRCREEVVT